MFDDIEVISIYSVQEAIDDGVLVEILKSDWHWLTNSKPVLATATVVTDIPEADLKQLWNYFAPMRNKLIKEGEQPYVRAPYKGDIILIVEDGEVVTFMYPSEY